MQHRGKTRAGCVVSVHVYHVCNELSFNIITCNTSLSDESVRSRHAVCQVVSHCPVTVEAWAQLQASPHGICGGQSDTVSGFSLSSLVSLLCSPCQYHSTNPPSTFIPLLPMLCNPTN